MVTNVIIVIIIIIIIIFVIIIQRCVTIDQLKDKSTIKLAEDDKGKKEEVFSLFARIIAIIIII